MPSVKKRSSMQQPTAPIVSKGPCSPTQRRADPGDQLPWRDHGVSCKCAECTYVETVAVSAPIPTADTPSTPKATTALRSASANMHDIRNAPPPPRPPTPSVIRTKSLRVSRRPVMLLWASCVAFKLGLKRDEALSAAGAVAAIFSQFKAQHLGLAAKRELVYNVCPAGVIEEVMQLMGQSIVLRTVPTQSMPPGTARRALEPRTTSNRGPTSTTNLDD